jgi:large conductance mechanosensitive channel
MSWLTDFRKFIMRGNVVDLAIGVVIGAAFTAIVNSMVDDLIMPFVSGIIGTDFTELSFQFNGATIAYGNFIQAVINFLIIALVVFFTIRWVVRLSERMGMEAESLEGIVPDSEREKEEEPEPEPEPEPSDEVLLLTEIRDLMKVDAERPVVRARIVQQPPSSQ